MSPKPQSQTRWWALQDASGDEDQIAVDPPLNWSTTPLQWLDPRGAGLFTIRTATLRDCWLLRQGGSPVGLIKRADRDNKLRTASEEWRTSVYRKRLGWRIGFARLGGQEPALWYLPDTARLGGCLDVLGERRYKLRAPLLRTHWRLRAATGEEIARFAFRRDGAAPAPSPRELRDLGASAYDEPLLPVVLLAAAVAIVIHSEQPSGGGGGG
jgi:hypothetical protein